MATKTYDPGTQGEIKHIGRGHYAVQSFRNPSDWYAVDLQACTCSCPDYQYRGRACKHQSVARAESARTAAETARTMKAGELHSLLARKTYRPEVEAAIREVLFEKAAALVAEVTEQVRNREYARV